METINQDLTPDNPLFWNQPTPVNCQTVRIVGVCLCIAAFFGVCLNGGLVFSFFRYKILRSPPNIYVLFIAILGLVASFTILPLTGTSSIYCHWLYKRIGCQLSAMLAFLYGCSSSYLLSAVSLSRCYIIIRPIHANRITIQQSVRISCFVVFLAFIFAMLPILGWNEYVMEGARTSCCINWYDRRLSYVSFTFFLFLFVYCVPLMIIIIANTVTLLGLRKMRQRIRHGFQSILNRKRIEMERRIVKSIIITTCGFLFTWTPYAITLFTSAFRGKDDVFPILITFYCACFAKSSAIWIPMLYMGTSSHFHLNFSNSSSRKRRSMAEQIHRKQSHQLIIIRSNDGSIVLQTLDRAEPMKFYPMLNSET